MTQDADILACLPMVVAIAQRVARKQPRSELAELVQVGAVALLETAAKFDPARGVKLGTYASQRVSGAMIDAIRKTLPTSRHAHESGDPARRREFVQMSSFDADLLLGSTDSWRDVLLSKQIQQAIRTLSPRDRRILTAYYAKELRLEDIGAQMRLPPSTVAFHRNRALVRLRAALAACQETAS